MNSKHKTFIFTLILFFTNSLFAQADKILGEWYTAEHKSKVLIVKKNDKYYGSIISLKEPIDKETGKAKVDKNNSDPNLKTRPIIGLNLIKEFKYDGSSQWVDGLIYDPENGKEYSCYMWYEGDDLHVRGYVGFSFLGRTTVWTRK